MAHIKFDISAELCGMLMEIEGKLVSTEIFDRKFVCDLQACKGACCIEGDAGAPLTKAEVKQMETDLSHYLPHMLPKGKAAVEKEGVYYLDDDGEPVTQLIEGGPCAFVYFDEQGITKCAIEKANLEGKTQWKKPLSCHLYPIRVKKFNDFEALNYDEWSICAPACKCGSKLDVAVYRFLREPIIRAYGKPFFDALEEAEKEYEVYKKSKLNK